MVDIVKNNLDKIIGACKEHHILSFYLIGSATTGNKFNSESDIDFLYRFNKETIGEWDYADHYFDLLFYLEELFGRKVDLVSEERITNPYFAKRVNETKVKLYES